MILGEDEAQRIPIWGHTRCPKHGCDMKRIVPPDDPHIDSLIFWCPQCERPYGFKLLPLRRRTYDDAYLRQWVPAKNTAISPPSDEDPTPGKTAS